MSHFDASSGERRQYPRKVVSLWVEENHEQSVYFRRTRDISLGGAYFDRAMGHAVGTVITLRIGIPQQASPIRTDAVVVRSRDNVEGLGMCVKFVNLSAAEAAQLRDFLSGV